MSKWAIRGCLAFVIAAAVLFATYWYKDARQRRQELKQALQMVRQEVKEKEALASLGNINIDPSGLTLGILNDLLRQPAHKLEAPKGATSTWLGWACGGDLCAVLASFPIPPEKDVQPSSSPVVLWVSDVGFGKPFQGSIGGIHLGDSVDILRNLCLQRGHEAKDGPNRIFWNKDWKVSWSESEDHRVTSMLFFNMPLVNALRTDIKGDGS